MSTSKGISLFSGIETQFIIFSHSDDLQLRRVFPFSQGLKQLLYKFKSLSSFTSKGISLFSGIETSEPQSKLSIALFFEGYFPFLRDWNHLRQYHHRERLYPSKGISLFSGIETFLEHNCWTLTSFHFEGYFPFLRDWNKWSWFFSRRIISLRRVFPFSQGHLIMSN